MKSGRKNLRVSSSDEVTGGKSQKKRRKAPENEYLEEILELKKTIEHWDNLFSESADETRMNDWLRIEVLGEPLMKKFAWAIPDDKALSVIRHFSPIVEMGAGKGYWSYLMQGKGIDVIPYDINPPEDCWTKVLKGDPKVLSLKYKKLQNRTLFLCYPDEGCAMAGSCLEHIDFAIASRKSPLDLTKRFLGDFIIHVGELIHTGCASGAPQSPWGRSSAPDFQVKLSEQFHMVLALPLTSFPFGRDFLTVWKRTRIISMAGVEMDDDGQGEEEEDNGEAVVAPPDENSEELCSKESGSEDEDENADDEWADVNSDERVFGANVVAAPAFAYLVNS